MKHHINCKKIVIASLGLLPIIAYADKAEQKTEQKVGQKPKSRVEPRVEERTDGATDSKASVPKDQENGDFDPWSFRFFQPSYRVYFDIGSDDPGELDIYNDGKLGPSVNLFQVDYNIKLEPSGRIFCGPSVGIGVTTPADDSPDETNIASDAPVLLLTAGAFIAFNNLFGNSSRDTAGKPTDATSVAIEAGLAYGVSTDEGMSDITDAAIYVGLAVKFQF